MGFIVLVQGYNEAIIVTKKKSKSSCVVCSLTWFNVWCLHTNENWIHPSHDHWCWHNISIHHSSNITLKKVIFQPWEKKLWMFVVGSLWALKGGGCISLFWNLATSMERSLRSIAKKPMLGKLKWQTIKRLAH